MFSSAINGVFQLCLSLFISLIDLTVRSISLSLQLSPRSSRSLSLFIWFDYSLSPYIELVCFHLQFCTFSITMLCFCYHHDCTCFVFICYDWIYILYATTTVIDINHPYCIHLSYNPDTTLINLVLNASNYSQRSPFYENCTFI